MKKKGLLNIILDLLIIIVIFGVLTAITDYYRMSNGEIPILNIKKYNEKDKKQTFRGIFYQAERTITSSEREILSESSEVKFTVLTFNLDISKYQKETKENFTVKTKEVENCEEQTQLYYSNDLVKVYTYCLDEIRIKKDKKEDTLLNYIKKDINILEDLDKELTYLGLEKDQTTLVFKDYENISNQGLTVYKCNKENMNDIYLTPQNTEFQPDFCINKEDILGE